LAAIVCFGLWNKDGRQLYFNLAVAFLAMTGGIYAVERAIVTEGERLQNDVVDLCQQFRRQDPNILEHFSNTAPELKKLCESAMETVKVHDDLRLSAFETTFTGNQSQAKVHFRANATISTSDASAYHPFRCVLTYRREAGQWKIIQVERLDPINGSPMGTMERR
jgi:hypothetical protein